MTADKASQLADRLDELGEEIADLAIEAIRTAMRNGQSARPTDERTLTQARRAVAKASHLLRGLERGGAEPDDAE